MNPHTKDLFKVWRSFGMEKIYNPPIWLVCFKQSILFKPLLEYRESTLWIFTRLPGMCVQWWSLWRQDTCTSTWRPFPFCPVSFELGHERKMVTPLLLKMRSWDFLLVQPFRGCISKLSTQVHPVTPSIWLLKESCFRNAKSVFERLAWEFLKDPWKYNIRWIRFLDHGDVNPGLWWLIRGIMVSHTLLLKPVIHL